jgi:hypothetical protein
MDTEAPESDGIYRLRYCSICDSSTSSVFEEEFKDNPFLVALGQLQRESKVDLTLGSCITCKGILWHVTFVLK